MVLLSLSTLSYHRHTPAPGCAKRKVTRSARGYMSFARSMSTAELRDFASELADAAAEVIKPFFRCAFICAAEEKKAPLDLLGTYHLAPQRRFCSCQHNQAVWCLEKLIGAPVWQEQAAGGHKGRRKPSDTGRSRSRAGDAQAYKPTIPLSRDLGGGVWLEPRSAAEG